MADAAKWMAALRKQRKEHQVEINQIKLEYEAKLLQEKKQNEWLNSKPIDSQRKLRMMIYELEQMEVRYDALQKRLRRAEELWGSTQKKTHNDASVASDVGR